MSDCESILSFKLYGRFAHFRKFYTNASSLSYLVPPRTVIIGILGSLLKLPRDSYYEIFNENYCKISVAIVEGTIIKKMTQSINMLHDSYFKYLSQGRGKFISIHSQCKLELLYSEPGCPIEYIVYLSMPPGDEYYRQLEQNIRSSVPGYGIYLGQRQFRANIEFMNRYAEKDIQVIGEAEMLDSICLHENVINFFDNNDVNIVIEQIPVHMKKETIEKAKIQPGREPVSIKRVLFEKTGKRLYGKFKNCLKVADKVISFY